MGKIDRALAHIEKVEWVKPIDGADNIELIGILGWVCIAHIGEFHAGDIAVYIEIDSKCPENDERFKFLESKHYKVKTMKLSKFNVISQGLAIPITEFPELHGSAIGTDVTDNLHITYAIAEDTERHSDADPNVKYKAMTSRHSKVFNKPFVKKIMKYKFGRKIMFLLYGRKKDEPKKFPSWISKTDEIRIENAPFYLDSPEEWVVTEKLDGTSGTFAVERKKKDKFEYIVCSRNVRQKDRNQDTYFESNIYWEMSDKYNLKYTLIDIAEKNECDRVVIQGECIGNVQGNPYKLEENELYVFNLICDGVRYPSVKAAKICESYGLKFVPIIETKHLLPLTMEEMKLEADGLSTINPKVKREGYVYRSQDGQRSFKNVSREYLLKHHQ